MAVAPSAEMRKSKKCNDLVKTHHVVLLTVETIAAFSPRLNDFLDPMPYILFNRFCWPSQEEMLSSCEHYTEYFTFVDF